MNRVIAIAPALDKSNIVVVMAMIAVMVLSVSVFTCLFLMVRNSNNMKLKKAMIDKGMSADEIERVLAAKNQV